MILQIIFLLYTIWALIGLCRAVVFFFTERMVANQAKKEENYYWYLLHMPLYNPLTFYIWTPKQRIKYLKKRYARRKK